MSIVLPVAMLSATVLGGIGIMTGFLGTPEKDSIQLASGQRIRVGTEVRLTDEAKKDSQYADLCLNTLGNGTVTSINPEKRLVTFRCRKNGKSASEKDVKADILDVVNSGITSTGISIPGGFVVEGTRVRLLASARANNRGKGLASPFASAVGTVTMINPKRKEVMVRTENLNNKGSYEEFYSADDLEFVSGPSSQGQRAITGGTISIGSTVRLRRDVDGKIDKEVVDKYSFSLLNKNKNYRLTGKKFKDALGILREWESFGRVTRILSDPKSLKDTATVRCVSKDPSKSVIEEDYDLVDLEAVPASSVPRPGIPIFGGMANVDIKVKLRAERKEAVSSKPLGRPAFGDEGTVIDIQPTDKDNLKILVICNIKNAEELTKEWYEPEDLEIAEPEETDGEAVFGGRATVGSTVRVRQSARGKKCLGTMEVGDVGMVKGIDPGADENLKINVTCGRSMNSKKSEWYDPRDLELFFGVEDKGTPLAQAQADLLEKQQLLNALRARQEPPTAESLSEEGRLEELVKAAQQRVDELTGKAVDMTKATEVYKNAMEKLEAAKRLKYEIEDLRLKVSKETTCSSDGEYASAYKEQATIIYNAWTGSYTIPNVDISNLKPIQYSNLFEAAWKELHDTFLQMPTRPTLLTPGADMGPLYDKTQELYAAKIGYQKEVDAVLEEKLDTESSFSKMTRILMNLSRATLDYDSLKTTPLKSSYNNIDRKIKALKESARDIETAAYSGDTPTEKLLKRIEKFGDDHSKELLEKKKKLEDASSEYFQKFKTELNLKLKYDIAKFDYDEAYRKALSTKGSTGATKGQTAKAARSAGPTGPTGPVTGGAVRSEQDAETKLDDVQEALKEYLNSKKKTLVTRKAELIASGEYACIMNIRESAYELFEKTKKIIDEKCGNVGKVDEVVKEVDNLIGLRKQAFLMSQAAINPSFGKGELSGKFKIPVGDADQRIELLLRASELVNDTPTIKNLVDLVNLCGVYEDDKNLPAAKALIDKYTSKNGGRYMSRGGDPTKQEFINARRAATRSPGLAAPNPFFARAPGVGSLVPRPPAGAQPPAVARNVMREGVTSQPLAPRSPALARRPAIEPNPFFARSSDIASLLPARSGVPRPPAGSLLPGEATATAPNAMRQTNASLVPARSAVPRSPLPARAPATAPNPLFTPPGQAVDSVVPQAPPGSRAPATAPNPFSAQGQAVESVVPRAPPGSRAPARARNPLFTPPGQAVDSVVPRSPPGARSPTTATATNAMRGPNASRTPVAAPATVRNVMRETSGTPAPAPEVEPAAPPVNFGTSDACNNLIHYHLGDKTDTTISLAIYNDLMLMADELGMTKEEIDECLRSKRITVPAAESGYAKKMIDDAARLLPKNPSVPPTSLPPTPVPVKEIKDLAKELVDDQIVRLKSTVVNQGAAMDLALQRTNEADKAQQNVLDSKNDLQFALLGSNDHSEKVGGAVDFYQTETKKLKMCYDNSKKLADEQYKKGLEEIEKLKAELTEKSFKVEQRQQGQQQGKKDVSAMTDEELDSYIRDQQERVKKFDTLITERGPTQPKSIPDWKNQQESARAAVKRAAEEKKKREGKSGGNRRITMRRRR